MKKGILASLLFGTLLIAGTAIACEQGTNCIEPPTPPPNCGTPDCNGSSYVGGNFHVVLNGAAMAWGKQVDVFSGGQYDYRARVGTENDGIQINAIGGYFTEDAGQGKRIVGGKAMGTGSWGRYTQW